MPGKDLSWSLKVTIAYQSKVYPEQAQDQIWAFTCTFSLSLSLDEYSLGSSFLGIGSYSVIESIKGAQPSELGHVI